jgi:CelD/BcsL family acetyltransferase involved in cellulose biosynthesis
VAARVIQFDSAGEIRAAAAAWDDLWRRSDVAIPLARAEMIAQWIEQNAPRAAVRAIAIEQDGQFVAALPLIGGRLKRVLPVARLPMNVWSWAGDLILDSSADAAVLDALLAAIARLGWPLVWLDAVPFEATRWRRFAGAAEAAGLSLHTHESFRVGRIEIDHDWQAYERHWSKSHRRRIRRTEQHADDEGGATLVVQRELQPHDIEPLLRRGLAVEDASWKGRAGSSVLKSPAALAFYLQQARQIATWGELQLTFLELNGRPIAFEYGWNSKGVYYSFKVGYDEAFARLSPGQLLRQRLLRRFFADPAQHAVDFVGPLSAAVGSWATSTYPVGRLVLSSGSLAGGLVLHAYRRWWPRLKRTADRGSGDVAFRSAEEDSFAEQKTTAATTG